MILLSSQNRVIKEERSLLSNRTLKLLTRARRANLTGLQWSPLYPSEFSWYTGPISLEIVSLVPVAFLHSSSLNEQFRNRDLLRSPFMGQHQHTTFRTIWLVISSRYLFVCDIVPLHALSESINDKHHHHTPRIDLTVIQQSMVS